MIETERLVLRAIRRDEAEQILAGRRPADLTYADGYPSVFALEVMEMIVKGDDRQIGPFFMIRRSDGAVLGDIGGHVSGADASTVTVGYDVAEPAWGRGYASEALRGLIEFLFAAHGATTVRANTMTDHIASRRVMERAGMHWTHDGTGTHDGQELQLAFYEAVNPGLG